MAGRLTRRGRDATLRALKVESLLNLKRPRKNWGEVRALLSSGDIFSSFGGKRGTMWGGSRCP